MRVTKVKSDEGYIIEEDLVRNRYVIKHNNNILNRKKRWERDIADILKSVEWSEEHSFTFDEAYRAIEFMREDRKRRLKLK